MHDSTTTIRLYLDEDVFPLLASVIRSRGHDAVSAHELGRAGFSDQAQFEFASCENRAVLTFNVRHFVEIAGDAIAKDQEFSGAIVSGQLPFKEMIRRVSRLLNQRQSSDIQNSIVWLSDYRQQRSKPAPAAI